MITVTTNCFNCGVKVSQKDIRFSPDKLPDGNVTFICPTCFDNYSSKVDITDKDKFDFLYKKISIIETEIEKLKTVQLKLLDKFDQQIIQSGAN